MNFIDIPKIADWKSQEPVKYVQEKLNGYFCEVYCDEEGMIHVFFKSRGENMFPKFPPNFFPEIPPMSCLWGELFADGVAATSVPTLLIEKDSRLQFSPFAVPMWAGVDKRDLGLAQAMLMLKEAGFKTPFMAETYMTPHFPDTERLLKNALDAKIEGFVLKAGHCKGWYKLKPIKTCDVFVVGWTKSESMTYYGKLRAFEVAVFDNNMKQVTIASIGNGLTANFKNTCNPDEFVGQVMEVAFQDVTPHGNLQFPRFLRWRDDKLANDCSINQL